MAIPATALPLTEAVAVAFTAAPPGFALSGRRITPAIRPVGK